MNLFGLEPLAYQRLILSVGSHRKDRPLSPLEVADSFQLMMRHGATLRDCAGAVHLDGTTMVSRFLRLLQLDRDVAYAVDWGQSRATMGFTTAADLSRIKDAGVQRVLYRQILTRGLTSSEVKQVIQVHKQTGFAIPECVDQIAALRPEVDVRHVIIGSIIDPDITRQLKKIDQKARDAVMTRSMASILSGTTEFDARLTPDKFTIAGDALFFKMFQGLGDEFEAEITKAILAEVSQ